MTPKELNYNSVTFKLSTKFPTICILSSISLKVSWVKKEIVREFGKYFELNVYQNM